MPTSTDNQDYGKEEQKNRESGITNDDVNLTSDDQKGKQQVDADVSKKSDKPADQ